MVDHSIKVKVKTKAWRFIASIVLLLSTTGIHANSAYAQDDIYLPLLFTSKPVAETGVDESASTDVSGTALPQPTMGIWIGANELAALPTSGPAWERLKKSADQSAETPDLSDQNSDANAQVLAKALVYARTGQTSYRDEVVKALQIITQNNTESGGRTLALGRELAAYVIAADLIDLGRVHASLDAQFRSKLRELLTKKLDGMTLQGTHEVRANNWGTHAGASRAAVAIYLGDRAELERTATVFHGWLGDRSAYSDFSYKELSWQVDANKPVGINPVGATKDGHSIDGALPEEMRRGGSFKWPAATTGYAWEGLQGAIVQAAILNRAGYPTWQWENRALLRAVQFLYTIGWPATGDDEWQIWLINQAYGTSYTAQVDASPGKNMGWTSWTHSISTPTSQPPTSQPPISQPPTEQPPTNTNRPPTVSAGRDQALLLPGNATLTGEVNDDGGSGSLTIAWSKRGGPGDVTFGDARSANTSASFSQPGTYVLRLTADDGEFSAADELTVMVDNGRSGGGSDDQNDDELTFGAVADAMVKSSSPKRNYGTVSTIRLRDTEPFYKSYLQFNVAGLTGSIQSAKLRLFVTDASKAGGSVYAVSNNGSNGVPWTENDVTWQTAPAISGSPLSTLGKVESDRWVEFDVTAAINDNGLYTFGFDTTSSNSVLYSSKEGANPPQLIVTTGTFAVQTSAEDSVQTAPAPSIDLPESQLDARLVQEMQQLEGGTLFYLPVAEKP